MKDLEANNYSLSARKTSSRMQQKRAVQPGKKYYSRPALNSLFFDVVSNYNIISSHKTYKIKEKDDKTMYCKARIAPHGNADCDKNMVKTDHNTCSLLGFRVNFSIYVIFQFYITKFDVKIAFLQCCGVVRQVFFCDYTKRVLRQIF